MRKLTWARSWLGETECTLGLCFSQVLEQLVGDASLEKFRKEYEKLHEHLKKVRGALCIGVCRAARHAAIAEP